MLWTSDSLRMASLRPSHAILDRPCKTSLRQKTWHNTDVVNAGVGIDPDRRADRGVTGVNHMYGFVYDAETVGPSASLNPRKIQHAPLRFYDELWDVDRHRDSRASLGRCSRPLMGHAATTPQRQQISSSVQGWQQGQLRARALGRRELPGRGWLRLQRLGRLFLHLARVSSRRAG